MVVFIRSKLGFHHVAGHGKDPGMEIAAFFEVVHFFPDDDVGILQDAFGTVGSRYQRDDTST